MRAWIRDGIGVIGCGLVAYGSWEIYPPAGFIVLGVLLLVGRVESNAG